MPRLTVRGLILAFVVGCAVLQTRPVLPDFRWAWLLPALVAGGWAWPKGDWGRPLLALLCAGLAGFYYAAWRADSRLEEALPPAWEGRAVRLLVRVDDLPRRDERGVGFQARRVVAETRDAPVPERLSLGYWVQPGQTPPLLAGGDCLRLEARLYRPHGQINPQGFDYEGWLFQRGVRAVGTLTGPPQVVTACGMSWRAGLDRLRDHIRSRLLRDLEGQPYAGVVAALAVGDQDAIPDAQWTLFRKTGVTHLLSVSGLHITLLAGLTYALANRVWRRVPALVRRWPAPRAAAWLGLACAAGYVALAGFGIPAQRTLFMLTTVVLLGGLDARASPSRVLTAALGVVCLLDPWAALAPGFWLSFGAVAVLMYAGQGRLGRLSWWHAWGQAQWAVTLALAPVLLWVFHEVSLVSPLTNAFAIPLISFVAVPLTLLAAFLPWAPLAWLAHAVVALTLDGLAWMAGVTQPVWHGAAPGIWAMVLALAGILLLLLPRGWPGRWLGLVCLLPLFFPRLDAPYTGAFRLEVLDVGQGLAVVVRTARHTLLYDAGPRHASGQDAGQRVVAPFLYGQGLGRLDGLVVSHDDIDHSGGGLSLLADPGAGWLLTGILAGPATSPHGQALRAAAPQTLECVRGQRWSWDGVDFQVLYPPGRYQGNPRFADNDRSCVVRVSSPHGTALLTGDVARLGELTLLEQPRELPTDVLVVAHHGSRGSSMVEFVAAVRPRLALVSAGHRNRFGHPAPEVVRRYRQIGAQVLRTDRLGALRVEVGPAGIAARGARQSQRRYWHGA